MALFPGFANVWTPVALSYQLKDRPLAITVAGTRVVLFRDGNGRAAALEDRCPHRGVALSLGHVKDGCLTCPFHGWQFNGEGAVTRVPWNPDAKISTLGARAFPTRERAGQVWLFTGESAVGEPEVSPVLESADVRVSGIAVEWAAHWTRAMENMLDWAHLPFVHRNSIGRKLATRTDSRMDVHWEEKPWGASSRIDVDGQPEPGSLDFRWPNQMNLFIPIPKKTLVMAVACIPKSENETTMLLVMARSFMKSSLFDGIFHRQNLAIALEDKAIVESSSPSEVPRASSEQSVRTDGLTLHFRKRYDRELRVGEGARSA